jgi:hypothetical protein
MGQSGEQVPCILLQWDMREEYYGFNNMRQRNNESGSEFIQRFREVRSHCYSLNLSDGRLAELALQRMSPVIRKKFDGQEFKNLDHLVHRVSAFEG